MDHPLCLGRSVRAVVIGLVALAMVMGTRVRAAEPVRTTTATAQDVMTRAEQLAKWQLASLETTVSAMPVEESPRNPRGWQQAVFWLGMIALAERTDAAWIKEALLARGRDNAWMLGARLYNADDQLIGQPYLWAAQHGAGTKAIVNARAKFDEILAAPPRARSLTFLLSPMLLHRPHAR